MCLAVPGRILTIEGDDPILRAGKVDFAGIQKRVHLSAVPEAKVGDYVLVQVGFTTRQWTLMEVCGGQTHAIVKFGVDDLLPPGVTLVHGPGCPVCVTPLELIEKAIEIASRPGVTFCSFGDMLRS